MVGLIMKTTATFRTRAWDDESGCSCTIVQFRNDLGPGYAKVHIQTNMGWVPVGNSIDISDDEAEKMAKRMADNWKLTENEQRAAWYAGWEE